MPINNDLSITYNIPTEMKEKFTKELMADFRYIVIETFKQNDIKQGREPYDYENMTYYEWWVYMEGTGGYCDSFRKVCEKHGLNDVIEYYNSLPWYDSDLFDGEFGDLLIHFGLIQEGNSKLCE